jgi:hypothetical protein
MVHRQNRERIGTCYRGMRTRAEPAVVVPMAWVLVVVLLKARMRVVARTKTETELVRMSFH